MLNLEKTKERQSYPTESNLSSFKEINQGVEALQEKFSQE